MAETPSAERFAEAFKAVNARGYKIRVSTAFDSWKKTCCPLMALHLNESVFQQEKSENWESKVENDTECKSSLTKRFGMGLVLVIPLYLALKGYDISELDRDGNMTTLATEIRKIYPELQLAE